MSLLAAAFVALGAAALVCVLAPLATARWLVPLAWVLDATGSGLALAAGARGLAGHSSRLDLGDLGGLGPAALQTDRLSSLFVLVSFCGALAACLAGARPDRERRRLPALVALLLASVLVVMTASNLFVLLLGWELLTLTFYLLSGFDRSLPGRPRAAVLAATFGKASGAALLVGGLLAAHAAGGLELGAFADSTRGAMTQLALALLLAGFAVKVGLVPVQIWLPSAYGCAPGAVRGLMAGVAVNVGFYGMWRALDVLGPAPSWLAVVVLLLAGITALLGISHAAVSHDLTALVAWSSVENAGVVLAGFGTALVGSASHQPRLLAAGLLAATAQVIAHTAAKTLMFTVTAIVERQRGSVDLEDLYGVASRHRLAGAGLVVGSLTLAGLPLTAGFASEWLTLESLMQQFRIHDLPAQLASAAAAALIALTVGIAGVTFVRLVAFTAFSSTHDGRQEAAERIALGERLGISLLIATCLGLAMATPWEVRIVAAGLRPLVGDVTSQALASRWVVQPVYGQFSALSPPLLWLVIPMMSVACAAVAAGLSGSRLFRVRRVSAWSSGTTQAPRSRGYTSFAYANPMRKVLANVLLTRSQLREVEAAERQVAMRPRDADLLRDVQVRRGALLYDVDVVEVVERYLYVPASRLLLATSRQVRRLQSGRLDAYMAYMLVTVVAVLALVTALR